MSTYAPVVTAAAEIRDEEIVKPSIHATITVAAGGAEGITLSTASSKIWIEDGTKVHLEPTVEEQPATYHLLFEAGEGIVSFQIPAAEFPLDAEDTASIPVNPGVTGRDFRLSFTNDIPKDGTSKSVRFFIRWKGTLEEGLLALFHSTDPTILLDPPKS